MFFRPIDDLMQLNIQSDVKNIREFETATSEGDDIKGNHMKTLYSIYKNILWSQDDSGQFHLPELLIF